MGMKKEQFYCGYTFRHTWATIAQNDCDANIADVAFGLNHSQGYKDRLYSCLGIECQDY